MKNVSDLSCWSKVVSARQVAALPHLLPAVSMKHQCRAKAGASLSPKSALAAAQLLAIIGGPDWGRSTTAIMWGFGHQAPLNLHGYLLSQLGRVKPTQSRTQP